MGVRCLYNAFDRLAPLSLLSEVSKNSGVLQDLDGEERNEDDTLS